MLIPILLGNYELSTMLLPKRRWPTAPPSGTKRTSSFAPGYAAPSDVYTLIHILFLDNQMMCIFHLESQFRVLV
jgi:hypothetical protein